MASALELLDHWHRDRVEKYYSDSWATMARASFSLHPNSSRERQEQARQLAGEYDRRVQLTSRLYSVAYEERLGLAYHLRAHAEEEELPQHVFADFGKPYIEAVRPIETFIETCVLLHNPPGVLVQGTIDAVFKQTFGNHLGFIEADAAIIRAHRDIMRHAETSGDLPAAYTAHVQSILNARRLLFSTVYYDL